MPKTKHQKQQEAIERARFTLPLHRKKWMEVAFGSPGFVQNQEQYGYDKAVRIAEEAYHNFKKAAEQAHADLHGNPLSV